MRSINLFLVLLLTLVLQATLFVQKPFIWVQPNLTLLLILFVAYFRGQFLAMMLGIAVGLFQDIVYSSFIGMHMFSLGVTGYFAGALFRVFLNRSLIILILVILGFTGVSEFINYGIGRIFGWTHVDTMTVLIHAIRLMIFNGIFALFIYPWAEKIMPVDEEWRMGEGKF